MVVLFSTSLLIPVYLVSGIGRSNSFAGAITATLAIFMLVGSMIAGRLSEKHSFSKLAFSGGCFILSGLAIIFLYLEISIWLFCGLSICGIGISLIQTPSTVAITLSVKKSETGAAMGIFNMSRFIFGGLGSALASTFYDLGIAHTGKTSIISINSFQMGMLVPTFTAVGILFLSRLQLISHRNLPHDRGRTTKEPVL
jgi:MFS family permease